MIERPESLIQHDDWRLSTFIDLSETLVQGTERHLTLLGNRSGSPMSTMSAGFDQSVPRFDIIEIRYEIYRRQKRSIFRFCGKLGLRFPWSRMCVGRIKVERPMKGYRL